MVAGGKDRKGARRCGPAQAHQPAEEEAAEPIDAPPQAQAVAEAETKGKRRRLAKMQS